MRKITAEAPGRSAGSSGPLALDEVVFSYGRHAVLHGLTTEFSFGISGLLGVNGAGKTTALRLLAGLACPSRGAVSFDGHSIDTGKARSDHRAQVGFLPQSPRWYPESTVAELVSYVAVSRLRRGPHVAQAVAAALDAADMTELRDTRLGQLSGGQLRRAFLAQAVVHDPPVLILDEPTAGLDPVQRSRLRERVLLLAQSRVVVWATHIIDDLVSMADQVVVLDCGVQRWRGTPGELVALGTESRPSGQSDAVSAGERGFLTILSPGQVSE